VKRPPETLTEHDKEAMFGPIPTWREHWWKRWRCCYGVADEDGACAGNLRRRVALNYAEGRASLGHTTIVYRRLSKGRIGIVAEFLDPRLRS
jgi:hypothetical protein